MPTYSPAQRAAALTYGIVCHLLFGLAIATMAVALFTGLRIGQGPFLGWAAVVANGFLVLSFPIFHTRLLTSKGRKFMAKLVPLGIGPKLSWTVFSTISSLQLLAVFWLWSPSGIVWWQATGWLRIAIGIVAFGAWLLLRESMAQSQITVQTGYIGWSSVFFNRKPTYNPFSTTGLYRHVRQPIYISFTLILWLTATMTPDLFILATGWTAYCIIGSALKEKRFVRCFGDAFRQYQKDVPFWIPRVGKK